MKKMIHLFSIAALLLLQFNASAQDNDNNNENKDKKKYPFSQTKKINKSYNVSASDKLDIDNKFGSVDIRTWNKNEIKVDVDITTSADTQDWANTVLNDIDVDDKRSGNTISLKTLFVDDLDKKEGKKNDRKKKYDGKNSHQSMEVNYVVYMPATNALEVDNEFGPTIVPDLKGEVSLTSKFGKLTTGALTNVKKLWVEFGKANFGSISNANVTVKFSKAEFEKVSGNMKLNFEFCSATKVSFDNSVTSLDVKASYSTVNLRPVGDPSASYTISTSFGSFKNRTDIKFTGDDDDDNNSGPKFDHKYSGRSGNGSIDVKATTSFGKVILGEANAEDMRDKDKDKEKRKNRTT